MKISVEVIMAKSSKVTRSSKNPFKNIMRFKMTVAGVDASRHSKLVLAMALNRLKFLEYNLLRNMFCSCEMQIKLPYECRMMCEDIVKSFFKLMPGLVRSSTILVV